MRIRLLKFWDSLRSSYWFVPSLMAVGAVLLSFGMIALDRRLGDTGIVKRIGWIYSGSPEGARALLSMVAGSMITVAGTTFSIVIVALTLASSQFGPRILRNFMRDTGNQVVLGTFIATFIYCLLLLRTIRGLDGDRFIPQLSITVAVGLALIGLGVLIFFIHHAARSIQAPYIVAHVGHELQEQIAHVFPEHVGREAAPREQENLPENFAAGAGVVCSERDGYIQAMDEDALLELATECDLILRLEHRPGEWVVCDAPLAEVWPAGRLDGAVADRLRDAYVFGIERTQTQDVEFAARQLEEIAVRALSPGINDPFTAMNCLDWLGAGLVRMLQRRSPAAQRYDRTGTLRMVANPVGFAGLCDVAFNKIRQYGRESVGVTLHLLETIAMVAPHAHDEQDRATLLRHAEMVRRSGKDPNAIPEPQDRTDVEARFQQVVKALQQTEPGSAEERRKKVAEVR